MAIGLQGSLGTIFFDQLPSTFKVARLLEAANLNLKASALVSNSFAKQLVRKVDKFWRLFGLSESARKAYALDSNSSVEKHMEKMVQSTWTSFLCSAA